MSKNFYEKPSTELLVVRFEEGILTGSPTFSSSYGTEEMTNGGEENF